MKIRSPAGQLRRVGMEVTNVAGRSICTFECLTSARQFANYLYLSEDVAQIRLQLETGEADTSSVIATLRPVSPIEFIWRSDWASLLRSPESFFRCYSRPPDSFMMNFAFPQPSRFANQSQAYSW